MTVTITQPRRATTRWPWVVLGLFVALAITGIVIIEGTGGSSSADLLFATVFFFFGLVGALISSRMPGNRIGFLLLWVAGTMAVSFIGSEFAAYRVGEGHQGNLERWFALLGDLGWLFGLLPGVLFLLQLFPDGRPASPRWRVLIWLTWASIGFAFVGILASPHFEEPTFLPNPIFLPALEPFADILALTWFSFLGLVGASAVSLVMRFRRASGQERQQIKWVAFAAAILLVSLVLSDLLTNAGLSIWVTDVIAAAGMAALPAAIGIAIFRFHLWELDVVVRKAVLAGLVVLILMGVFIAISLLGRAALDDAGVASALSAAAVGFAAWPAFRIARRVADRLVYGRRATPYEVLAGFADRVGATYADDDVLERMATAVGEGVGAERAEISLDLGGGSEVTKVWSRETEAQEPIATDDDRSCAYAVEFRGERLGRLAVRKPAGDRLHSADRTLVEQLAAQAGPVLHNVALTEQLKARLEDLRAAQRRLVTAQDEERRRLERNIHDGAQQQLVALAVKLRLAESMVGRDPEGARELLEGLQRDAGGALDDLRDLARGIYPPLLADKGLAAALEAQANRSALPVHVRSSGDLGRFPQEVEAAVYFSCLEGLQNIAKYAGASDVTVTIARHNGDLTFEVVDDGQGFDPAAVRGGSGLQGIVDRVAALAGGVEIASAPGKGTTLRGTIPVAASDGGEER
jgi:signal transduction histidine kinase